MTWLAEGSGPGRGRRFYTALRVVSAKGFVSGATAASSDLHTRRRLEHV